MWDAVLCHRMIYAPFTEIRTVAEKALSWKMNSVLDKFV